MSRTALALILALAPLAAACGTTSEAAPARPATTAATAASSTGDAHTSCMEVMTRNRTCTDDFIPALVDARARHDTPAGIADAVAKDRAGVIAQAKQEWATDSTDDALARTCEKMTEHVTADDLATAKACLAKAACGEYVTCITPEFEKHLHK